MKYRQFIERYFYIDEPKTGQLVPFKFNPVQAKFYDQINHDYGEKDDFQGLRDLILKARREGFTSLILALFAAIMILSKHQPRFLEISYKDDATSQHYRRLKTYLESYFYQKGVKDPRKVFDTDNKNEIILKHNRASFYVGTASSKTGERGGTVQGLLFSEAAFYPDTQVMTAKEIIEGSMRMVDIESGLVIIETTANGIGNYYHKLWQSAVLGKSRFKPRFYGWREMYTENQFKLIASEFNDQNMLKQEYPETPEEAFISSSNTVIPKQYIEAQQKFVREPIRRMDDVLIYEDRVHNHYYSIGGDPSEGKGLDDSSFTVIDKMTGREVAFFADNMIPPDKFAEKMVKVALYFNNAIIVPEINAHGLAVLNKLHDLEYSNIFRQKYYEKLSKEWTYRLGWKTSKSTKSMMVDDFIQSLREEEIGMSSSYTVGQMFIFVHLTEAGRHGMGAVSGEKDDALISAMLAVQGLKDLPNKFKHN